MRTRAEIFCKEYMDEIMAGGAPFRRRALFRFMIRYVCPVFVLLILLSSVAEVMGWIKY